MQAPDSPHGYYRVREIQEREMAAMAKDPAVRQIHLELADKYRRLAPDSGSNL